MPHGVTEKLNGIKILCMQQQEQQKWLQIFGEQMTTNVGMNGKQQNAGIPTTYIPTYTYIHWV